MNTRPKPEVHIWGAPTLDWINVENVEDGNRIDGKSLASKLHVNFQFGGVFLLEKLITKMNPEVTVNVAPIKTLDGKPVDREMEASTYSPLTEEFAHTWSTWNMRGIEGRSRFRMPSDGISSFEAGSYILDQPNLNSKQQHLLILKDPGKFASSSFEKESVNGLMKFLKENSNNNLNTIDEILVRSSPRVRPIEHRRGISNFLGQVSRNTRQKTNITLVTKLSDLRAIGEQIGDSTSWEQMLDDVVRAVTKHYEGTCSRVVVTIGVCGAVFVNFRSPQKDYLIFTPSLQEKDDETELEGRVLGNCTCMLSAIATSWAMNSTMPQQSDDNAVADHRMSFQEAVRKGVQMIRCLNEVGYVPNNSTRRRSLEFPMDAVLNTYFGLREGNRYGDLALFGRELREQQDTQGNANSWTILEKVIHPHKLNVVEGTSEKLQNYDQSIFDLACRIVREGTEPITEVPLEKVNNWYSADRNEIELVRSVQNIIRDYIKSYDPKPISIGVFGPPGSGKSFVVSQIAKKLRAQNLNIGETQLTFNLSQLESPKELASAFHRARDFYLKGKVPLVFWDEFDSAMGEQALGWLKYFLSPMQDGEFAENGVIHPVGRAIFVFAGGTTNRFVDFADCRNDLVAKQAKKPDFVSRLRGYIDVKGPNAMSKQDDNFVMIRRAFLIHALLTNGRPQLRQGGQINVDKGVLNAFLITKEFMHGARSIENIIRSSSLDGKTRFDISCLPPSNLLAMHVEDVEQFSQLAASN